MSELRLLLALKEGQSFKATFENENGDKAIVKFDGSKDKQLGGIFLTFEGEDPNEVEDNAYAVGAKFLVEKTHELVSEFFSSERFVGDEAEKAHKDLTK